MEQLNHSQAESQEKDKQLKILGDECDALRKQLDSSIRHNKLLQKEQVGNAETQDSAYLKKIIEDQSIRLQLKNSAGVPKKQSAQQNEKLVQTQENQDQDTTRLVSPTKIMSPPRCSAMRPCQTYGSIRSKSVNPRQCRMLPAQKQKEDDTDY